MRLQLVIYFTFIFFTAFANANTGCNEYTTNYKTPVSIVKYDFVTPEQAILENILLADLTEEDFQKIVTHAAKNNLILCINPTNLFSNPYIGIEINQKITLSLARGQLTISDKEITLNGQPIPNYRWPYLDSKGKVTSFNFNFAK